MTAKRAGSRRNRIVTNFVRIPKPLGEGEVHCAACFQVVTLTKNGHTRKHRTPAGEDCAYRATYGQHVQLDELPPVTFRKPRTATGKPRDKATKDPSRLEAGSRCRECDKWLPGERSLCGRCAVAADQDRRRP